MQIGGTLAIADNAVAIDYATASPIDTVRADLAAGRITSTSSSATHRVAYAEASALAAVPPVFGTVDGTTLLIRVMRAGDANWDNVVNLADFNALAANFGLSARHWTQGNFNYDLLIDLADFNLLAANFGLSAGATSVTPDDWASLAAAVPEPAASAALAGLCALTSRRLRRRRRVQGRRV